MLHRGGQRPEHPDVGENDEEQAPGDRTLAQAGRPPLELVELNPTSAEAVDDPVGEAEEAKFLGGRRVDGEPVRVLGVPLRLT